MPLPRVQKLCGAKTRAGGQCQNPAMGNGRCRKHGGATPQGLASPHWKGKGRGIGLQGEMAARFKAALESPGLMSLREDAALHYMRMFELLEGIEGELGLWKE